MAKSNILYIHAVAQSKKPINDSKLSPQMMTDYLQISSKHPMATRKSRFAKIFKIKLRRALNGDYMIFDHNDIDIMIEAKHKELALLKYRENLSVLAAK